MRENENPPRPSTGPLIYLPGSQGPDLCGILRSLSALFAALGQEYGESRDIEFRDVTIIAGRDRLTLTKNKDARKPRKRKAQGERAEG